MHDVCSGSECLGLYLYSNGIVVRNCVVLSIIQYFKVLEKQ